MYDIAFFLRAPRGFQLVIILYILWYTRILYTYYYYIIVYIPHYRGIRPGHHGSHIIIVYTADKYRSNNRTRQ